MKHFDEMSLFPHKSLSSQKNTILMIGDSIGFGEEIRNLENQIRTFSGVLILYDRIIYVNFNTVGKTNCIKHPVNCQNYLVFYIK